MGDIGDYWRDVKAASAERHYRWLESPAGRRAMKKEAKEKATLIKGLESKYEVRFLTEYQWRVNGIIDLFPTNMRYHNIKTQERGSYNDAFELLKEQIK